MPPRRACDLPIEDRAELLKQSELGAHLSEPLTLHLAEKSTAVDFRRRRTIYRPGEPADALYLITRGWVKLSRIDPESAREAVIDIISAGTMFGESALYSPEVREKTAIAYANSRLLSIPVADYRQAMTDHCGLYDYTFRLVGQRLAKAEQRMADFALDAIPTRLQKLLVDLSERYGVKDYNGVLIDLPLPHREIASIIGSTRESITVRLNAMRREGIIDIVNRKILIKIPKSLVIS